MGFDWVRYNPAQAPPPPPTSAESDQFISWLSVGVLVLVSLFFRSVAVPFLNPSGETRRAVASSFYFNLMTTLYIWLSSATVLTVFPHFSGEGNLVRAAALFFPMTFASVAATAAGRFCVRMLHYVSVTTRMVEEESKGRLAEAWKKINTSGIDFVNSKDDDNGSPGTNRADLKLRQTPHSRHVRPNYNRRGRRPKMVAFQRPFRKLVKHSVALCAGLCVLYAHCWSQKLSAFKVSRDHGAGAVCRAAFSPLAFGGMTKRYASGAFVDSSHGVHAICIWLVWATCIFISVVSFALDEFGGEHTLVEDAIGPPLKNSQSGCFEEDDMSIRGFTDKKETKAVREQHQARGIERLASLVHRTNDGPRDALPMVPWFSIVLIYSVFDLLVAFKIFLGRYDARTMQPALQSTVNHEPAIGCISKGEKRKSRLTKNETTKMLQDRYPGVYFDMIQKEGTSRKDDGFWFDFCADTGDGFNSSYSVSRLLAQPKVNILSEDGEQVLPRGEVLIVGGDLAYPDPTEESYEKRFFRTFEDAMQPPPSFRRRAISTRKPAIPVRGWCTPQSSNSSEDRENDGLDQYEGPLAFAIPGNHDWFDGLSTYSRFILGRDWLGGWLLPQTRSYFAIKLPHGWWLFGTDLGLSADIDLEQFKFFADVAAHMNEADAVIIVNHEPHWVLENEYLFEGSEPAEKNLQELIDTHLKGRVRLRLAGDLHHYTRHVPTYSSNSKENERERQKHAATSEAFSSLGQRDVSTPNEPELIVSGGGGAFLHGTYTFKNDVFFGEKKQKYERVCCYPDEATSLALGWLNLVNFRFRNWRLDAVWAVASFGIASSLLPMCGIYHDFLKHNNGDPLALAVWLFTKILSLAWEIFASGRVSLLFTLAVAYSLFLVTDTKPNPAVRIIISLGHAAAHVTSALGIAILIECLVEWLITDDIVSVGAYSRAKAEDIHGEGVADLASFLYDEFNQHFNHVFSNITQTTAIALNVSLPGVACLDDTFLKHPNFLLRFYNYTAGIARNMFAWLFGRSILSSTYYIFDLPGLIALKHTEICSVVCDSFKECLTSHDPPKFLVVARGTMMTYLGGIFLYFSVMSVPTHGGVFGTWLALMLNVFKSQYNEGFSSLRIPHWKHVLKLHIDSKGRLEVFCLGLNRVPTRWKRDPNWTGDQTAETPSWSLKHPSKWIPLQYASKFQPRIIDYTRISKRPTTETKPPSNSKSHAPVATHD